MTRSLLAFSVLVALCGCGARTGLDDGHDGGGPTDSGGRDARDARPSCRGLPSCIEADITTPSGEVIPFAQQGEVTVLTHMGRGAWLETPGEEVPAMAVQLSLDATAGPVELSLAMAPFYVDLRFPEENCNVRGEGTLEQVDLGAGGVNEGTFTGVTREECPAGRHHVDHGWFRLTMPE